MTYPSSLYCARCPNIGTSCRTYARLSCSSTLLGAGSIGIVFM